MTEWPSTGPLWIDPFDVAEPKSVGELIHFKDLVRWRGMLTSGSKPTCRESGTRTTGTSVSVGGFGARGVLPACLSAMLAPAHARPDQADERADAIEHEDTRR